jgi:hypothetical protein
LNSKEFSIDWECSENFQDKIEWRREWKFHALQNEKVEKFPDYLWTHLIMENSPTNPTVEIHQSRDNKS